MSSEPTPRGLHGGTPHPIFQRRGEAWSREQRELPEHAQPRHEPEPERARIVGRVHLRPGEERERDEKLKGAKQRVMARLRPRLRVALGDLARHEVRRRGGRVDARRCRDHAGRLIELRHPADPPPHGAGRATEPLCRLRVGGLGLGKVRERRRFGDIGLEGAVRIEPGRSERPRLVAGRARDALEGQTLIETTPLPPIEDDGVDDAPPVEPDAGSLARGARRRPSRAAQARADPVEVELDLDPRADDARRRPPAC